MGSKPTTAAKVSLRGAPILAKARRPSDQPQIGVEVVSFCASCGSSDISLVGPIPRSDYFAGLTRDGFDTGSLWICSGCRLGFRFPRLSPKAANELYKAAPSTAWPNAFETRQDWLIARDWIKAGTECPLAVLDIGCSTGTFLAEAVGEPSSRYGLEPSRSASRIAAAKEIKILAADLPELAAEEPNRRFNVITAFDVIEHVHDPLHFLRQALKFLELRGSLIVASGNLFSPSFTLMGSSYWYAVIAEHVSFVSLEWCRIVAETLGLKIINSRRYSHTRSTLVRFATEAVANLLYRASPIGFGKLRRAGFGRMDISSLDYLNPHPPSWMSARDHFIVEFRRAL